ncbi:oligosaccharide flippase family protein [Pseudarcicella sp. GAP-15]|nr:oligosaccharide flippase family protein [Pseudarcicella sp. GAP-15]
MYNFIGHSALLILSKLPYILGSLLFAYFLAPDDYGKYVLYLTVINYLSIFCGLNFNQAYGRYLYEDVNLLPSNNFGSHILIITLVSFLSFGFIGLSILINYFSINLDFKIGFILLVISFASLVDSLLNQYCIKFNTLKAGLIYFFVRNFLLFFLVFFLVIKGLDLKYIFLIESIVSILGIFYVIYFLNFQFNFENFRTTLKYSFSYALPLLPYTFVLVILSQFDRLVINSFFGNKITGTYSFNYNFGIILSFLFSAIMNFNNNEFYDLCTNSSFSSFKNHQRSILFKFLFISLFFVLVILIFSNIIYPSQKLSEVRFLPLVISAILFFSIWQIWVRILGFYKLTKIIGLISIIVGMVYVVVLYSLFKFHFEYWYAYLASLLAYILMSVIGLYFVYKLSSEFVKPYIYDFFWYFLFLIISIVSVHYFYGSILGFILLLGLVIIFKRKYLVI